MKTTSFPLMKACLLALLLLPLFSLSASAAGELVEGDYTYVVSQGNAAITAYFGDDVRLTIPDQLGGYPVTRICEHAFSNCDTLVSVTIPDGVISIGEAAPDENGYVAPFKEYDATSIAGFNCGTPTIRLATRRSVFAGCDALTSVYLPDSVAFIYKYAFFDCRAAVYYNPGSTAEQAWAAANERTPSQKPTRTPSQKPTRTPAPRESADDIRFGE